MKPAKHLIKCEVRPQNGGIAVDIFGTSEQITGIDLQPSESSQATTTEDPLPVFYSELAAILLKYMEDDIPFDNSEVFHRFPFSEAGMTNFQRKCYAVILNVPFGYTI
ncbi:MAG TPA: hypothetical protein VKK79_08700, partial [Candidatus Lokiarchaeia archaeon]|nr:hypothetical protein [Candidatus Lokiarchaeia archaeon]